ncbi:MAG: DNA/RNA non-specific endonuclease [Bacteroidales bacterium]|nr:DNA/RNA non-specific endonuclease [Bacteroidales bacterium]
MSRKLTLIALSLLVVLAGCQKEDQVAIQLRGDYLPATADGVFFAVRASGAWTLSIEFPVGSEPWATVKPESGTGSINNAILSFDANPHKENRGATIVLTPASGAPDRVSITQAGVADGVEGHYGYDVAPMGWLELPACVEGDGREVLVHSMDGGKYMGKDKSGTRNWSCYWDYDDHMSLWVAYPLNNSLKGSGTGRTEAWGYDQLLPTDIQPDLRNGSYGGGWTRGHQIPSADKQRNYAENASTYVSTNMTPQQYDFNGKIWANLEGKVRNYASMADTLYVVTGALFDKSTNVSGISSGFRVKVPTHYFKALLYKGTSAYAKDTDGYLMAGFLLPHDKSIAGGNCLSYRMSIDELEAQTGIDFFPNLEKRSPELAQQLEAAEPNALFWN